MISEVLYWRRAGWLAIFLLLAVFPARSQFYYGLQQDFGRNQVSFTDFFWTYYRFDDFDTYFYFNGQELASFVSQVAIEAIPEISQRLNTIPKDKIQFIVFTRLTDFRQTNIGRGEEIESSGNPGGITRIVNNKVFLYFESDYPRFIIQIREAIARVLLQQGLYGGSLVHQVTTSAMPPLPSWFTEGLVAYIANPWNTYLDDQLRDAMLSGRFRKFNRLQGAEAILAGQALWKYIADKYGEAVLSNIVYLTRMGRSIDQGLQYTIGINLKTLLKEWEEHYTGIYRNEQALSAPDQRVPLVSGKRDEIINQTRLSPDGTKLAYISNRFGRYRVKLYDLTTHKTSTLYRGGYRFDTDIDYSFPLLAWHPGGEVLTMIVEKQGLVQLLFYNFTDKKIVKQFLYNFEKVLDFSYSGDGMRFVMSALQRGQSDIFIYDIPSSSYRQITQDPYDDMHPRFVKSTGRIVFSSNRPPDSLALAYKSDLIPVFSTNNLFEYNPTGKSKILRRITTFPGSHQIKPVEIKPGQIMFLSDRNGIYNRFIARFDSTIAFIDTVTHYRYFTETKVVTSSMRNILEQDKALNAPFIAEIVRYDNRFHIHLLPAPGFEMPNIVQHNTHFRSQILKSTYSEGLDQSLISQESERRRKFRNVRRDDFMISSPFFTRDSASKKTQPLSSMLPAGITTSALSEPSKFQLPKRRNYNVEYSINTLRSQVDFRFLSATYQPYTGGAYPLYLNPGANAFLSVTLTDLMEDYEINGGVRFGVNLNNNEYVLSFSNRKKRLNKQVVFHRLGVEEYTNQMYVHHKVHEAHAILTWPFNRALSLKASLIYKHDNAVTKAIDNRSLARENVFKNWGGTKLELIHDNTRLLGANLRSGMRMKIFGEYYQGINDTEKNMVVVGFDLRHYLPVHRNIVWANRIGASTSTGNSLLIYYLGGIDNWLIPRFNQEAVVDPEKTYAYQTLATNMRGFIQNIRNGNSFVVFNSEIRIPVFSYFIQRPIRARLIRDFQIVGFTDVGTAWTGPHPYSGNNHLFRQPFSQGPISGYVEIQKDPFVAGFGFGARTTFFGYFIKADYAWGYDDRSISKPIFYLSLGYDF